MRRLLHAKLAGAPLLQRNELVGPRDDLPGEAFARLRPHGEVTGAERGQDVQHLQQLAVLRCELAPTPAICHALVGSTTQS